MKKYNFAKYLVLLLVIGFMPNIVSAANVYFETSKNTVSVGDTFIVKLKIDSENEAINSAEGDIIIGSQNNNFVVNDFVLSESPFTLWPQTPSLSQDGKTVSFVGGVPGGLNANKITLFNIVVETSEEGDIKFSPKNMIAFANDGQGTKLPVSISDLTVKVIANNTGKPVSNEWLDLVDKDKKSPSVLLINIGREASMFEGKRFAFFTAIDDQSGVSHYDVSEDGEPVVRSGSMYVLRNQDDNSTPDLVVTVYDKAGNKTVTTYKAPGFAVLGTPLNLSTILPIIFVALLLILVLWFIVKTKRKNKNNA